MAELKEMLTKLIDSLDEYDLASLKMSLKIKPEDELPSLETLEDICTPTYIGPTWGTSDSDWLLPEHTLGWELAAWCSENLVNPNEPEKPWEFTAEQLRFLLWWYAVDERGKPFWRKGVLQRLKGWGKEPLLAVICIIELVAPCRFAGWDEFGEPIGKPVVNPLIQVSAVTQEQSYNTGDMFPVLLPDRTLKKYKIKLGIDLIRLANGRGKIQMLTSNTRALEGKRTTFSVLNEVHQWVPSNGGPEMYKAISRNLTKIPGARFLAITNAYMPGENSVGEGLRGDYEKEQQPGRKRKTILYDSVEADPRAPILGPMVPIVVEGVRGDATWLDVEAIQDEMATESIDIASSRRFWLNQIVTSDDRIYGPEDWDHLGSLDNILKRGEKIALGFDGGKSDDATALVAIRLKDMCVFPLAIWEMEKKRRDEKRIINYEEVDAKVRQAFNLYDVHGFYADVSGWESWIHEWTKDFAEELGVKASTRSPIGLDMRGNQARITQGHEALIDTIRKGKIKHDDDITLRKHVLNACWRVNQWGMSFQKENAESPNKVDGYAAMLLAFMAATDAVIRSNKQTEVRKGRTFLLGV